MPVRTHLVNCSSTERSLLSVLSGVTAPPPAGYPYTFGTTPLDTGLLLQGTLVPEPASTGLACLALIRRRMASS
jgi:hypothetical protein